MDYQVGILGQGAMDRQIRVSWCHAYIIRLCKMIILEYGVVAATLSPKRSLRLPPHGAVEQIARKAPAARHRQFQRHGHSVALESRVRVWIVNHGADGEQPPSDRSKSSLMGARRTESAQSQYTEPSSPILSTQPCVECRRAIWRDRKRPRA